MDGICQANSCYVSLVWNAVRGDLPAPCRRPSAKVLLEDLVHVRQGVNHTKAGGRVACDTSSGFYNL